MEHSGRLILTPRQVADILGGRSTKWVSMHLKSIERRLFGRPVYFDRDIKRFVKENVQKV